MEAVSSGSSKQEQGTNIPSIVIPCKPVYKRAGKFRKQYATNKAAILEASSRAGRPPTDQDPVEKSPKAKIGKLMISEPSAVVPSNPGGGAAVLVPVSPREGDSFSSSYTTTAVEKFNSEGTMELSTRRQSDATTTSSEPRLKLPFDSNGNVIMETFYVETFYFSTGNRGGASIGCCVLS